MEYREKLVGRLVYEKYNWVVGGWENSLQDGNIEPEEFPTREQLEMEVYDEVMSSKFVYLGLGVVPVSKDIRFLGKEKIRQMIKNRFDKRGEY